MSEPCQSVSSICEQVWLTCAWGAGSWQWWLTRPRHALTTVLCRCRWISASSWFHSFSCSGPFIPRPSSWICWILHTNTTNNRHLKQSVHHTCTPACWTVFCTPLSRLRPIPLLGIGIGPIPVVSVRYRYRRYLSRYYTDTGRPLFVDYSLAAGNEATSSAS